MDPGMGGEGRGVEGVLLCEERRMQCLGLTMNV